MTQYNELDTLNIDQEKLFTRSQSLPELVHLDDPAQLVMHDFNIQGPDLILAKESIDDALKEMQIHNTHILLVTNSDNSLIGIISSTDILGEKPITIIESRRIERQQITVSMIMQTIDQILLIDSDLIRSTKVGNIVNTLKRHQSEYALAVYHNDNKKQLETSGLFDISQISKQLHSKVR
jgi:CBS-domain-containing membrane protein